MLKNFWYACEFSQAITTQPKQITLLNQRIVLFRDASGQVVALKDQCPHRGTALSIGKVKDNCIRCPYHGWTFDRDGHCVEIPANPPGSSIPKAAQVASYPVQEQGGFIWLYWGDLPVEMAPPLPTLPDFPPSWRAISLECRFNAHYTRVVESLIDTVHIAFVHDGSFGSGAMQAPHLLAKADIVLEEWGASAVQTIQQPAGKGFFWKYVHQEKVQDIKNKYVLHMPNLLLHTVDFKYQLRNLLTLVPVDDQTTILKVIQFRNFLKYSWADWLFRRVFAQTHQQDQPIIESQYPQVSPIDVAAELPAAGDALVIAYRKQLKKCLDMGWGI